MEARAINGGSVAGILLRQGNLIAVKAAVHDNDLGGSKARRVQAGAQGKNVISVWLIFFIPETNVVQLGGRLLVDAAHPGGLIGHIVCGIISAVAHPFWRSPGQAVRQNVGVPCLCFLDEEELIAARAAEVRARVHVGGLSAVRALGARIVERARA
jgi:hypothetical protein